MAETVVHYTRLLRPENPPRLDTSGDKIRTKQSFKDEANIRTIMARFHKTGMLSDPNVVSQRQAIFGDFSQVGDFQSAQNRVIDGRRAFDSLSSKIRSRFNNSPAELLDFMADAENKVEAQELGIIPKDVVPAEPAPVAPVVPPVAPVEPSVGLDDRSG